MLSQPAKTTAGRCQRVIDIVAGDEEGLRRERKQEDARMLDRTEGS
jgi:hypothetical protein